MYVYLHRIKSAGVVKLVDTLDLGSSAARCVGSSPSTRTKKIRKEVQVVESLNQHMILSLHFYFFIP